MLYPRRTSTINRKLAKALSILFWLLVWHIAAVVVSQRILIVSPVEVVVRLIELLGQGKLWAAGAFSTLRIAGGFNADNQRQPIPENSPLYRGENYKTVRYFDIEANGFRSFKVENFITAY